MIFKEDSVKREHAQRVLFEQVKRTVPIEAVLAKYGIELKRKAQALRAVARFTTGATLDNSSSTTTFGSASRPRANEAATSSTSSPSSRRST